MLDVGIALFLIITVIVAVVGRVRVGPLSFSGADVPAMITTVLVLIRIAPWIRVRSAEVSAAVLWLTIGFLGSLGWSFFLHPFLFRVIAPFRATRTPARWAAIAYVGIAVLAAIGAARLKKKAWLLIPFAIVDVAARVQWRYVPPTPAIYAHVRGAKSMIELPLTGEGVPFLYLLAQTEHRVPLVNGTSGFETPAHEQLRRQEQERRYTDAFIKNAELLLVHEERAEMQPLLAKLQLVRREGTDALFRIPAALAGTSSAPRAAPPR